MILGMGQETSPVGVSHSWWFNGQKRTLEVPRSMENTLKRSSDSHKWSSGDLIFTSETNFISSNNLMISSENKSQTSESLKVFTNTILMIFLLKINVFWLFSIFVINQI